MSTTMKTLRDVVIKGDTHPTSLFMAMLLVLWGVWLLLPFNTFTETSIWQAMAPIAGENVWGLVFLGLGLAEIATLYWHLLTWHNALMLVNFSLWSFISAGFWFSLPTSVAPPTYSLVALFAAWVYLRDARLIREARRRRPISSAAGTESKPDGRNF